MENVCLFGVESNLTGGKPARKEKVSQQVFLWLLEGLGHLCETTGIPCFQAGSAVIVAPGRGHSHTP